MNNELKDFLEYGLYEEKKKWLTKEEKTLIEKERMVFLNIDKYRDFLSEIYFPEYYRKYLWSDMMWSPQDEFIIKATKLNILASI